MHLIARLKVDHESFDFPTDYCEEHGKDEAAKECSNYLHQMEMGKGSYTREGFERVRDLLGVYVLKTNDTGMSAQDVFC